MTRTLKDMTEAHSETATEPRKKRGFGSMDPEKQREIARQGGRTAHERGTAHEFTAEEAKAAGIKGGVAVSKNRAHMAEIGRKGGQARGKNLKAKKQSIIEPSVSASHSPPEEQN